MSEATIKNHAAFIWSVADLLRGDYKQSEYGKVILPLVVLRRLDCVLEPAKAKVLAEHAKHGDREAILRTAAGQPFFNTSKLDFRRLLDDPGNGRAKVAHQEHCPIGELLARGEDAHLEYKSTFRWDLKQATTSKAVETAVLKTIAAFLNSREGGTLLIGVADDGAVLGLESDYATLRKDGKDDADLFQLALTQAVLNAVGAAAATNVTTQIHTVDGHDLCRVHVKPSGHPVHADVTIVDKNGQHQKKRMFYVRMNNGARAIDD